MTDRPLWTYSFYSGRGLKAIKTTKKDFRLEPRLFAPALGTKIRNSSLHTVI